MLIDQKTAKSLIKKYGKSDHWEGVGTRKPKEIYRTICQGCGKPILSNTEDKIDCAVSSRGVANFWHRRCGKAALASPIRWERPA